MLVLMFLLAHSAWPGARCTAWRGQASATRGFGAQAQMRLSTRLALLLLLTFAASPAVLSQQALAASRAPTRQAAKARDWTKVVSATPSGGFVMGNPKARVKLVEFGSMTCSHCREFDEVAVPQLLSNYVRNGEVSWEFRNYVRDAFDVTASLIARCNGPASFFPLTRGLYTEQQKWMSKVQQTPQDQLQPIHDLPVNQQFLALAKVAGFQQWAASHGISPAKSAQCLGNEHAIDALVQMANDAGKEFPDFKGTPAFVINGKMVDFGRITADEVWPILQSKIRSALTKRS
jgi:protein-disulfide isomerase